MHSRGSRFVPAIPFRESADRDWDMDMTPAYSDSDADAAAAAAATFPPRLTE